MSRETYKDFNFNNSTLVLIAAMNAVIDDLSAQGYRLTVRQLYYQLVSKDIIENTERSYKRITGVANDARLAGMMDWDAIEDRTREFQRRSHWNSGGEILAAVGKQYHMDMWTTQTNRVFVIIEKEALVGIFESLCHQLDIPLLAARGYPSVSVVREFVKTDMVCGRHGKAMAAEGGCIVLLWFDGTRERAVVGYVGEDGIKADTLYKLNDAGKLVQA